MRTNIKKAMITFLPLLFLFVLTVIIGGKLLGKEYSVFLTWWCALLFIGIAFLPVGSILFRDFFDGGWLFTKALGVAVSGWFLWYATSLHLMKFTRVNSILAVILCGVISFLLALLHKRMTKEKQLAIVENFKKLPAMLWVEVLFLILFTFWMCLKGFKPEAYGTEKFMDYGFMTSMMRSEYMPSQDLWFAGSNLNYYYVGQFIATYLTKLAGVRVAYGYNLMLMTVAAFGFTLPFALVYELVRSCQEELKERVREAKVKARHLFLSRIEGVVPVGTGILAGLLVSIAGSLHYPIYRYIVPFFQELKGEEVKSYWFPNATRYIGYNPDTNDKTIHEFPSYSFILGDLHAHVINIMFVLTVLALLYAFLQARKKKERAAVLYNINEKQAFLRECFHPNVLAIGFFIGLFHTTNYWDFPIYFVVSGAIILFSNAILCQFSWKSIYLTAIHAVIVVGISTLTCLPFTLSFEKISTGVRITDARTPLYQLAILWGIPIVLIIMFIISRYREVKQEGKIAKGREKIMLFQYMKALSISDLFVATMGLCAIGLILLPELIYVVDIYSGSHKRANTMFKLTYQAYIMFGMCMAYIIMRFLNKRNKLLRKVVAVVSLILLIFTMGYFLNATKAWFGDVTDRTRYQGMDATLFMQKENYDDYEATKWLNENVSDTPVILEVNGDSYTYHERVSVITGLPTVLGWRTHEWLWRSDASLACPPEIDERANDIRDIYTSVDINYVKELIQKYDIRYIYVGELEAKAYEAAVNHELLKSLGVIVFERPTTETKDYQTYIVSVQN